MEGNMSKLTREAPKIVSALAAMLIAIATTGCSTLMEPDHADAALLESNSGLSANHRYLDFSSIAKIPQPELIGPTETR